jgi:pimeloyl-ACP methyl ester carboxylesterase
VTPSLPSRRIRSIDAGGIALSVTEQPAAHQPVSGDQHRLPVVMLHGFPDIGYSWRHQMGPIAEAGHCVLAPDQRGCGWSDAPDEVDAYGIFDLVGDVIGLLDAEDIERCVLVGHDWGAIVSWHVALMRPDRLAGVALLSVPYQPRNDCSVLDHVRSTDPDGPFAYLLSFQDEGVAESTMDLDPIGELRSRYPDSLTAGELENYARAFARSGFRGAINWYRNMQKNWERTRPWHGAPIVVPTTFIGGDSDFVVARGEGAVSSAVSSMAEHCLDHRDTTIVPGGHWAHQENPGAVNLALLDFLASLSPRT